MNVPVRRLAYPSDEAPGSVSREWLVTNGLGGYASGTISGMVTRRYHGLLVAALPAPIGRMVMLSDVDTQLCSPSGQTLGLEPGPPAPAAADAAPAARTAMALVEFRLELGLPVWRYEGDGFVVEKHVLMPYRQNTVHLTYRLLQAPGPVRLEMRPFMHVRRYGSPLTDALAAPYAITAVSNRFEVVPGGDLPVLRLLLHAREGALTLDGAHSPNGYLEEQCRGYECAGTLWSPGYFCADLGLDAPPEATLVASTERWETVEALAPGPAAETEMARRVRLLEQAPERLRSGLCAELVIAADPFLITPAARPRSRSRCTARPSCARRRVASRATAMPWPRPAAGCRWPSPLPIACPSSSTTRAPCAWRARTSSATPLASSRPVRQ